MKLATQVPVQSNTYDNNRLNRVHSATVSVNRISSVEEELANRICRERNGQRILTICETIIETALVGYEGSYHDLQEFRERLFDLLITSREYTRKQVHCIVELSLDILYAQINNAYRRTKVDIGFLISTATGNRANIYLN